MTFTKYSQKKSLTAMLKAGYRNCQQKGKTKCKRNTLHSGSKAHNGFLVAVNHLAPFTESQIGVDEQITVS